MFQSVLVLVDDVRIDLLKTVIDNPRATLCWLVGFLAGVYCNMILLTSCALNCSQRKTLANLTLHWNVKLKSFAHWWPHTLQSLARWLETLFRKQSCI